MSENEEFIIPMKYEELAVGTDDLQRFQVETLSDFDSAADISATLEQIENSISDNGPHAILEHSTFDSLYSMLRIESFESIDNRSKNQLVELLCNGLRSLSQSIITHIRSFERTVDNEISTPLSPRLTVISPPLSPRMTAFPGRKTFSQSTQTIDFEPATLQNAFILRNSLKMYIFLLCHLSDLAMDDFEKGKNFSGKSDSRSAHGYLKGTSAAAQLESFDWVDRHFIRICDLVHDVFELEQLENSLWKVQGRAAPISSSSSSAAAHPSQIEEPLLNCVFSLPMYCLQSPALLRKTKVKAACVSLATLLHGRFGRAHPFLTSTLSSLLFRFEHAPTLLSEMSEVDLRHAMMESALAKDGAERRTTLIAIQGYGADEELFSAGSAVDATSDRCLLADALLTELINMPGGLGGIEAKMQSEKESSAAAKAKAKQTTAEGEEAGGMEAAAEEEREYRELNEGDEMDELAAGATGMGDGGEGRGKKKEKKESDGNDLIGNTADAAAKSVGLFLSELAGRCPFVVLRFCPEILPYFGSDSYQLRNGIAEMCMRLIKALTQQATQLSKAISASTASGQSVDKGGNERDKSEQASGEEGNGNKAGAMNAQGNEQRADSKKGQLTLNLSSSGSSLPFETAMPSIYSAAGANSSSSSSSSSSSLSSSSSFSSSSSVSASSSSSSSSSSAASDHPSSSPEEKRLAELNTTIDNLFSILTERVMDVSAYARARVLHCWAELCASHSIPHRLYASATAIATDRLNDKTPAVRRAAAGCVKELVENNPFGAALARAAYQKQLDILTALEEEEEKERQQAMKRKEEEEEAERRRLKEIEMKKEKEKENNKEDTQKNRMDVVESAEDEEKREKQAEDEFAESLVDAATQQGVDELDDGGAADRLEDTESDDETDEETGDKEKDVAKIARRLTITPMRSPRRRSSIMKSSSLSISSTSTTSSILSSSSPASAKASSPSVSSSSDPALSSASSSSSSSSPSSSSSSSSSSITPLLLPQDPHLLRRRLLAREYLTSSLLFIDLIETRAFPALSHMLRSKSVTDVASAVQLATALRPFRFEQYKSHVDDALAALVWSPDAAMREACLAHYREVVGLPEVYTTKNAAIASITGVGLSGKEKEKERERERKRQQRRQQQKKKSRDGISDDENEDDEEKRGGKGADKTGSSSSQSGTGSTVVQAITKKQCATIAAGIVTLCSELSPSHALAVETVLRTFAEKGELKPLIIDALWSAVKIFKPSMWNEEENAPSSSSSVSSSSASSSASSTSSTTSASASADAKAGQFVSTEMKMADAEGSAQSSETVSMVNVNEGNGNNMEASTLKKANNNAAEQSAAEADKQKAEEKRKENEKKLLAALRALTAILPALKTKTGEQGKGSSTTADTPLVTIRMNLGVLMSLISSALQRPPNSVEAARLALTLISKSYSAYATLSAPSSSAPPSSSPLSQASTSASSASSSSSSSSSSFTASPSSSLLPTNHRFFAPCFALFSLCTGKLTHSAAAEWMSVAQQGIVTVFTVCTDPQLLFRRFIPLWAQTVFRRQRANKETALCGSACLGRLLFLVSRIALADAVLRERKAAEQSRRELKELAKGNQQSLQDEQKKGKRGKKIKGEGEDVRQHSDGMDEEEGEKKQKKAKKHSQHHKKKGGKANLDGKSEGEGEEGEGEGDEEEDSDEDSGLEAALTGVMSHGMSANASSTNKTQSTTQSTPAQQIATAPPGSLAKLIVDTFGGVCVWLNMQPPSWYEKEEKQTAIEERNKEKNEKMNTLLAESFPSSQALSMDEELDEEVSLPSVSEDEMEKEQPKKEKPKISRGRYAPLLSTLAASALSAFIMLDPQYASDNMQLAFTLLQDSASPETRANMCLSLADAFTRYPSLAAPYAHLLCIRIHDEAAVVRRAALSAVNSLTRTGMMKLRMHFPFVALCLVEKDAVLAGLAEQLVDTLAHEGKSLYNLLAETLVSLASGQHLHTGIQTSFQRGRSGREAEESEGPALAKHETMDITRAESVSIAPSPSAYDSTPSDYGRDDWVESIHILPSFFLGITTAQYQHIADHLIKMASLNESQTASVAERIIRAIKTYSRSFSADDASFKASSAYPTPSTTPALSLSPSMKTIQPPAPTPTASFVPHSFSALSPSPSSSPNMPTASLSPSTTFVVPTPLVPQGTLQESSSAVFMQPHPSSVLQTTTESALFPSASPTPASTPSLPTPNGAMSAASGAVVSVNTLRLLALTLSLLPFGDRSSVPFTKALSSQTLFFSVAQIDQVFARHIAKTATKVRKFVRFHGEERKGIIDAALTKLNKYITEISEGRVEPLAADELEAARKAEAGKEGVEGDGASADKPAALLTDAKGQGDSAHPPKGRGRGRRGGRGRGGAQQSRLAQNLENDKSEQQKSETRNLRKRKPKQKPLYTDDESDEEEEVENYSENADESDEGDWSDSQPDKKIGNKSRSKPQRRSKQRLNEENESDEDIELLDVESDE